MTGLTEPQKVLSRVSQDALVSVIITIYNRMDYLKSAIQSALRQTYQNIEIIVADDCSTESPQKIIDTFQDERIILRRNSTNLGLTVNISYAFKNARGKYVASLNDDDLWNEDFLEKLIPPLEENPDLALAFCDHYIIDSNGTIDWATTEENSRRWKRDRLREGIYKPFWELGLVHQAVSPACAAVIRKDAVDWEDFPAEVGFFWDLYTAYLASRSGCGAYYYPEKLTRYRVHSQSITAIDGHKDIQAKIEKAKNHIFCFQQFMEDDRLAELQPYFQQKWAHANTSLGIGLMRLKKAEEARPYFLKALGQKLNLRTVAALALSFAPQSLASRF